MTRRDSAIVISTGAIRRLFTVLFVIAIVALVAVLGRQYLQRTGVADQIDRNAYQAVFLTGGQVFFGHALVGDESLALADVFYLAPNTDSTQSQQLGSLIKRGSELHGPREPMIIERGQVLFIENMRDDSQVVQAIKRFKAGEQPAPAPAATAAPAASTPRPSASR